MTISSMMNIALSGMRTEQNRLATVAGNIAHSGPGATTGAAGPLPLWERKKNHSLGAIAPSRRFFR
jgi:flagellar basal body rod protein FlgC